MLWLIKIELFKSLLLIDNFSWEKFLLYGNLIIISKIKLEFGSIFKLR